MTTADASTILYGVGTLGLLALVLQAVASRKLGTMGPLRIIRRGCVYLQAAGALVLDGAPRAWRWTVERWPEYVDAKRREW